MLFIALSGSMGDLHSVGADFFLIALEPCFFLYGKQTDVKSYP